MENKRDMENHTERHHIIQDTASTGTGYGQILSEVEALPLCGLGTESENLTVKRWGRG